MVPRILTAIVGGTAITIAMLLGMHEATRHFKDIDPKRYFSVVDFIPAPETSNRPQPPPAPSAQPDRPSLGYERGSTRVPLQRPVVEEDSPASAPDLGPARPDIESGEAGDAAR